MGSLDVALVMKEASKLKRQEDLENTYKLVHEEHVVLMSSSEEDEEEATGDEFRIIEPTTSFQAPKSAKKGTFNLFDEKLVPSLDVAKTE